MPQRKPKSAYVRTVFELEVRGRSCGRCGGDQWLAASGAEVLWECPSCTLREPFTGVRCPCGTCSVVPPEARGAPHYAVRLLASSFRRSYRSGEAPKEWDAWGCTACTTCSVCRETLQQPVTVCEERWEAHHVKFDEQRPVDTTIRAAGGHWRRVRRTSVPCWKRR